MPSRARSRPAARSGTKTDPRRGLPSVDALLRRAGDGAITRPLLKRHLQEELDGARRRAAGGGAAPSGAEILRRARRSALADLNGIGRVVNATGVLLHTGLGRAPLADVAARAAMSTGRGYSDLEVDRETGSRGRRTSRAESLLIALCGAEDALVVNNNAAALLLSLSALARGRDVLVSRGELIEIGGEFRLPEIMSASGARLVEVGTTNRTRPTDYRRALSSRTGLILKVHPSNYRVVGFTQSAGLTDVARLAAEVRVPLLFDAGSGLLDRYAGTGRDEPTVVESLRAGAGLVAFSGDKLLGGPQAGILAGRADLIERLRRHPIARAVRVDKMTVAALEATLRLYATDRRAEVPLWRLVAVPRRELMRRARAIASELPGATARRSDAAMGGGSLPERTIPSAEVAIPLGDPDRVAALLRAGRPPVFCRVHETEVSLDLRAVPAPDDAGLVRAVRRALSRWTAKA